LHEFGEPTSARTRRTLV